MAKPHRRQEVAEDGAGSLTTGKLNAVRAAFKAGVKPSAIARQFGISQSDVRRVLAQGKRREA
jgi:DNA-binding transcriptional regulator LsrR (DeoR family)